MMSIAPFKLSDGLFLERSHTLLPWFKSLNQLTKKGGRPLPEKGKRSQLYWEHEVVFDGMGVSIQAVERGSGMFFLGIKHEEPFESAKLEYEAMLVILGEKLGAPNEVGNSEGYPWARWRWGEICVNLALAERFTDYVAFSVSNGAIE